MQKIKWSSFLWDVFIVSLGAYGGPEAHYGVITDQLVIKKKYITEEELIELVALTGILPGPSSTQTIISVGHKIGGPLLAMLTFLVWALPVLLFMTILSFLSDILIRLNISQEKLRFIGPMAVGFIVVGAYKISRKVIKDKVTLILLLFGAFSTYFFRQNWVYPAVLIIGGIVRILTSNQTDLWNKTKITPPWKYLMAFIFFAIGGVLASFTGNTILKLFDSFYRYGYLVIGGGQVVIPLMHSDLVEVNNYMTNQEFLTGFGLVQGLPGPMFSFSAYAGGMASRGFGELYQVLGALASGIGIFLPGILLIFFVYPIWENLKEIKGIKVSLGGITAVAGGLIIASGLILMQKTGFSPENIIVMISTIVLLLSKKVAAPIIVVLVLISGFIF